MDLSVKKHKKNNGVFFRKTPFGLDAGKVKSQALKDISDYILNNDDFGDRNYIHIESIVLFSTKYNKPFINI
jgi:hypothetical protein